MIGKQRTRLMAGVFITAMAQEGRTEMVNGKPARLAILADAGTVLAVGAEVARGSEAVAVNSYRTLLKGEGYLRVTSNPLQAPAK